MNNVWYTGDQHFWHTNIIKYCDRPFKTVEEMNEAMIERWNEVVKEEDIIYHVGDFGLGSYDKLKEVFDRLNGRKIIIRGNHDRSRTSLTKMGWEVHKQPFVLDDTIILTHLPIVDASAAVSTWNDMKVYQMNLPNICGHIHEKWKRKGSSYNAGVDVHDFRPVSLKELLEEKK